MPIFQISQINVRSPPTPPAVIAIIEQSYQFGQQNTVTTDVLTASYGDSTLTVRANSLLIMVCIATYPIVWEKDGQDVSEKDPAAILVHELLKYVPSLSDPFAWIPWWGRNRTYSFYSGNDTIYNNSTVIEARPEYMTIMRFGNVSDIVAERYYCKNPIHQLASLTTSVAINIYHGTKEPPTTNFQSEILQTGFNNVLMNYGSSGYCPVFSFLYYLPTELQVREYFILPDGDLFILTHVPTILGSFRGKREKISTNFFKCTLLIVRSGDENIFGKYQFVIETQLKNGTKLNNTNEFWLNNLNYINMPVEPPEGPYMQISKQVRFYAETTKLVEVQVTSFIDLVSVNVTIFNQISCDVQSCTYDPIMNSDTFDICGILSISQFYQDTAHLFNGVRIILNGTKSCSLLTNLYSGHDEYSPQYPVYINMSVVSEKFANSHVVIQSWPNSHDNQTMTKGGNITLQCLVPRCSYDTIGWCKTKPDIGCVWVDWKGRVTSTNGTMADESTLRFESVQVDSFMVAAEVTFSFLEPKHTGIYRCIASRGLPETSKMLPPEVRALSGDFTLTVIDPLERPTFTDGKQEALIDDVIKRGGKRDLRCEVRGNPKPNIIWISTSSEKLNVSADATTLTVNDAGTYKCDVTNSEGSNYRKFAIAYDDAISTVPLAISIPIVVLFILSVIGIIFWRRRRANEAMFKELAELLKETPETIPIDANAPLNDQGNILPYNQNYEINRNLFTITKQLGEGEFGKVFKGQLNLTEVAAEGRPVAIKVPNNPANIQHHRALIAELKIMIHIRPHVNILSLVGACTSDVEKKQLFVLTEFCFFGSLRDYLIEHCSDFERTILSPDAAEQSSNPFWTIDKLLNYSYQAANGMEYLAAENIIHRDLALRNLLLTHDHMVKVSDFGMSRRHQQMIYRKHLSPNVAVPIWWMALESFISGEYTQKSDIIEKVCCKSKKVNDCQLKIEKNCIKWSFGVVLWEIFSCGQMPYAEYDLDSVGALISWLRKGRRLDKPEIAIQSIYDLMLDCWKEDANIRPSFSVCKRRIGQILEQRSPATYKTVLMELTAAWRNLSTFQQSTSPNQEDASAAPSSSIAPNRIQAEIVPNANTPVVDVISCQSMVQSISYADGCTMSVLMDKPGGLSKMDPYTSGS